MGERALKRPIDRLAYRREEAADSLGVSPTHFDKLVREGDLPAPIDLGGVKVWPVKSLEDALAVRVPVDSSQGWNTRSGL